MAEKGNFLKEYFKNKNMIGAVAPSSKKLAKKMLENIDFSSDKLIIELGPGTGVFTDLLIKKMGKDAKLLIFELNDAFYSKLSDRINDPRVQIIHDSAENIANYLSEEEVGKQDVVLSSLPLMMFPNELRENIVAEAKKCLSNSGKYIQFQYSLQSKKYLKSKFKEVSVKFTPLNVPPAFVYTCSENTHS